MSPVLKIDAQMNASQQEVVLGDSFEIRLEENPTTGYRWRLRPLESKAITVESDTYQLEHVAVGGGGVRTWKMLTHEVGTVEIHAECVRAAGSSAARTFDVTIRIQSK